MTNTVIALSLALAALIAPSHAIAPVAPVTTAFDVETPDSGLFYPIVADHNNPIAACLKTMGFHADPYSKFSDIYAPESAVAACAGNQVSFPSGAIAAEDNDPQVMVA